MDASIVSLSAVGIGLIPIVLGLVSIIKNYVDSKWAPLFSLVLGILLSFLVPATSVLLTLLQGILVGLAASGLYSGTKKTMTIFEK